MGPELALPLFVGSVLTLFFGFRPATLLEDMEHISMSGLTFAKKSDGERSPNAASVITPVILPVKQIANNNQPAPAISAVARPAGN
jgi:hypothetical protein